MGFALRPRSVQRAGLRRERELPRARSAASCTSVGMAAASLADLHYGGWRLTRGSWRPDDITPPTRSPPRAISGIGLARRLTLEAILKHLHGLRRGGPGGRSAGTCRHGDPRTGSIERAGDGSARAVTRGMDYRAATL